MTFLLQIWPHVNTMTIATLNHFKCNMTFIIIDEGCFQL